MIWAPKYRSNRESEDIVVELSEIYNKLIVSDDLLELFRRSLVLWTGKFVSDKKKLNKIIGELNMSAQEAKLLKQDILDARIDGMICRAEDAAMKEGIEKGERNIILKLLEDMTPEEVSEKTAVSLEEILEVMKEK
ncbi:hypothetical protein [Methanobrevibacter sp.]